MALMILEDIKAFWRGKNALFQLIIVNVAVWIAVMVIDEIIKMSLGIPFMQPFSFMHRYLGVPATLLEYALKFWTLITYMFMHGGFRHIAVNMIILYWFGNILASYLGEKRLINTYFLGGIAGGIFYLLAYNLVFMFGAETQSIQQNSYLIGASGSVLAIVVAAATIAPNHQVKLLLLPPITIRYIALALIVLTTLLDFSINTGGKLAHLGGVIWGYTYIRQLQNGNDYGKWFDNILEWVIDLFKPGNPMKVAYRNTNSKKKTTTKSTAKADRSKQEKTDVILDKISKSGYESLTKEEKEFLFKISKDG